MRINRINKFTTACESHADRPQPKLSRFKREHEPVSGKKEPLFSYESNTVSYIDIPR